MASKLYIVSAVHLVLWGSLMWLQATASVHFQSNAQVSSLDYKQWINKRVMFIVAHPDDIEGVVGGLVSILTKQNTSVYYVITTNGDKGGVCYNETSRWRCPSEDLAALRRREQINAANFLGVKSVQFLDLEDGMLTSYNEAQVREKMTIKVRQFKPHVVFTWFPYPDFNRPPLVRNYPYGWADLGYHPDHQACGRICMDTVVGPSAGDELMFAELADLGLAAWQVEEFYIFDLSTPTHYVDITGAPLKSKEEAFLKHKSQYDNATIVREALQWISGQLGKMVGVENAETFRAFF